ncbi:MAG: class F sortase [Patescibacteria group bacterium]|nr:class F sortase [Patescibacteria group bacterium]
MWSSLFHRRIDVLVTILVVGVAAGMFVATAVHAVWFAPELQVAPSGIAPATTTPQSAPVRLIIPSLGIDANIQYVGLSYIGHNIGVPNNFIDVAWYKYGTVPGEQGTAIIDGHVDNGLSLAGVFKHLNTITPGAHIYVLTQSGKKLQFVVTDVQSYPYQSVPMGEILSANDAARLDLITCDGGWVAGQRTYDHRLVVYTELQSSS